MVEQCLRSCGCEFQVWGSKQVLRLYCRIFSVHTNSVAYLFPQYVHAEVARRWLWLQKPMLSTRQLYYIFRARGSSAVTFPIMAQQFRRIAPLSVMSKYIKPNFLLQKQWDSIFFSRVAVESLESYLAGAWTTVLRAVRPRDSWCSCLCTVGVCFFIPSVASSSVLVHLVFLSRLPCIPLRSLGLFVKPGGSVVDFQCTKRKQAHILTHFCCVCVLVIDFYFFYFFLSSVWLFFFSLQEKLWNILCLKGLLMLQPVLIKKFGKTTMRWMTRVCFMIIKYRGLTEINSGG